MRNLKRAILSIFIELKKTVLITLLMVTVLIMIIVGLSIKKTLLTSNQNAQNKMKAEIVIQPNTSNESENTDSIQYLNKKLVDTIEKSKNVIKTQITLRTLGYTELKTVNTFNSTEDIAQIGTPTNQIYGFKNKEDDNDFVEKNYKLVSGTLPYESKNEHPLMISKKYAEINNLKIGDSVSVKGGETYTKGFKFEIVGLFETIDTSSKDMSQANSLSNSENNFYTNLSSAEKVMTVDDPTKLAQYEEIKITLDKINNVRPFLKRIKENKVIDWEKFNFKTDLDQYDKLTNSIDNISKISEIILWITIIAGLVILFLVMTISFRNRKFEIGLLLSMGETKSGIVLQIFTEVFVIFILSFILSFAISIGSSDRINSLPILEQSQKNNQLAEKKDLVSDKNNKINVTDSKVIFTSFIIGLTIIITSTLLPLIFVFKKDPKSIMLSIE